MKLEKRSAGAPGPLEETAPKSKKPVVVYIMVLFIAAFLLMAWSLFSHQRSNTEALGRLQTSVGAIQEVQVLQDQVIALQKELAEAREDIQELEHKTEQQGSALETRSQDYMAIARLQALEQLYAGRDLEACRKVIDSFESDGLVDHLSDNVSPSDQELGLLTSSRERYYQLKEAVESAGEQAGP